MYRAEVSVWYGLGLASLIACGDDTTRPTDEPTDSDGPPTTGEPPSDTDEPTDPPIETDTTTDLPPEGPPPPTSLGTAPHRIDGIQSSGQVGHVVVTFPDIDGDGDEELLFSVPNLDNDAGAAISVGAVQLVPGGAIGVAETPDVVVSTLFGENSDDHLGQAIVDGDVDGNGSPDLIVGATRFGTAFSGDVGAVYVSYSPLPMGESLVTSAGHRLYGLSAEDETGAAIAVGDMDGDATREVAVGAPGIDVDEYVTEVGTVFIFDEGMPSVGLVDSAPGSIVGVQSDQLGKALAAPGDTNGDGVGDLWIGARDRGFSLEGEALLFYGPLTSGTRDSTTADVIITGLITADATGSAVVSAGDMTDDGLGDVWVSAPGALGANGEVFLVPGGAVSGLRDASPIRLRGAAVSSAGSSIAGDADLDGDGGGDVVVGGITEASAGLLGGAVWIVLAPEDGTSDLDDVAWKWFGESEFDQAGTSVAVGEVTGDGAMDVLVGAIGRDRGLSDVGAVYVVPGSW